jgi:Xaa-Pro aminopeptidase
MPLRQDLFERHRRRFMDAIGDGAAALFAAAPERLRSNDVEYRYRQQSDFLYLTGFAEPGALCLLLPGHPKHEYVLFVRPRDLERETWTGRRAGIEGAQELYRADVAHAADQIDHVVPGLLAERDAIYAPVDRQGGLTARVVQWLEDLQPARQRTGGGPTALHDARPILHEMRLHKSEEEVACMRRAAAISCEAHSEAMRAARPGTYEYEIEALLEFTFRRRGGNGPAYPSIVASGDNATILHYTDNSCELSPTDLLLVDAGAEYDCYCSDVTRTFPVGDRFDGRQRAVYEIVLAAQRDAIELVRPGNTFEDVHLAALRTLIAGLVDLGILRGSAQEIEEKEIYRPLYMHRTSHWLGLDVHDVGLYRQGESSRKLESGMVLTVEPGLYIADHTDTAPQWHGLGVRIEDDILVTDDGCEVMSAAAPKEIDDIEALRRDGAE